MIHHLRKNTSCRWRRLCELANRNQRGGFFFRSRKKWEKGVEKTWLFHTFTDGLWWDFIWRTHGGKKIGVHYQYWNILKKKHCPFLFPFPPPAPLSRLIYPLWALWKNQPNTATPFFRFAKQSANGLAHFNKCQEGHGEWKTLFGREEMSLCVGRAWEVISWPLEEFALHSCSLFFRLGI